MINGKPITDAKLLSMILLEQKNGLCLLQELEEAGVFSRNTVGAIYSRRMVKDEHIHAIRSAAGSKGGNASLGREIFAQAKGQAIAQANPADADAVCNKGGVGGNGKPSAWTLKVQQDALDEELKEIRNRKVNDEIREADKLRFKELREKRKSVAAQLQNIT